MIENHQALRDSAPCLSRAATLPKATKLELGRGAHLKTPSSANHTAVASQPTGRIAKAASWLHVSRVSPALLPPERPSHTHTPKLGFGGRGHEVSKHQIQSDYYGDEQADAGPSRETKLSSANGDREIIIHLPCSADHEQDWQPYSVDPYYLLLYVCPCVCVFFPSILDIKFVGRTSRGHTGGRSHRIFNLPSFCGACLDFCREKDSAIPFPRRP